MKQQFKIPVSWEVFGTVHIDAETLDEAIEIFDNDPDMIPLPRDSDYIDGSFKREDKETIELHNNENW